MVVLLLQGLEIHCLTSSYIFLSDSNPDNPDRELNAHWHSASSCIFPHTFAHCVLYRDGFVLHAPIPLHVHRVQLGGRLPYAFMTLLPPDRHFFPPSKILQSTSQLYPNAFAIVPSRLLLFHVSRTKQYRDSVLHCFK